MEVKTKILQYTLVFQGFYYASTGLLAIVSLDSFSRITGHYGDAFEMHSIAAMSFVIGLFFIWAARKEEIRKPAGFLALALALAIFILELIYLPQIGNPTLFWVDFAEEGAVALLLMYALLVNRRTPRS